MIKYCKRTKINYIKNQKTKKMHASLKVAVNKTDLST